MKVENVIKFLELYRTQNIDGIKASVTPNVEVSDPHFPMAKMVGVDEVVRGLRWSFQAIERTDFDVKNILIKDNMALVEIDTVHRLKVGLKYQYIQLLKIEYIDDKIFRVTTYVTYPPGGLRGVFRRGVSIYWQVKRKIIGAAA